MLGAIVGDIVGSRFEWNNIKTKDFELFTDKCDFTDDSVMTLAIAKALTESKDFSMDLEEKTIYYMQKLGRKYPDRGYGNHFLEWIYDDNPKAYNSFGYGSAMRVSPVAYVGKTLDEVKNLSRIVTSVSHNHPEGIKGAECTAASIFLAKNGSSKQEIKDLVSSEYYDIDFTLDQVREAYQYDVTCMGSLPISIVSFLEANSFEDGIRNVISVGGDSDTLAAIAGPILEAYYGIPEEIKEKSLSFLSPELIKIYDIFFDKFPK